MAGEWRETTLGEVVRLQRGHDLPDKERQAGPVPILGSFGVTGWHNQARATGPGVTVGRSGASIGVVSFITDDYWPLNTCMYVTDFMGNDPRFCYYWLGTLDLAAYNSGSAQPSLNRNYIYGLPVRIPEPPEQRAIAQVLSTLDDKIELNRRISETLEAMARAIFKSWFVDFDPVRAKVEGPDSGLPKEIADLFPDRFEESELGEILAGWGVGTLADLGILNPEVWTKETRPAELNYVDLSNTKWGRIEAVTSYEAADAPSRAQRVLRPADTIVGTVRPGNGSYAFISESGLTGSTGFAVLRPQAAQYAEFVYLAGTAADNIDTLAHLADGAAYPAVRPEVVAATPIVRPSDEVFGRFSRASGPLLAKVAQNERESRTLAALRDALLPRLLSGELRVGGWRGPMSDNV
ncbi:MAG: restriction endonuclease subunit S [Gemmatimonadetes bacterium]|nr:restriction endonuclease subunit S [Gemmatimonadota bacterium]